MEHARKLDLRVLLGAAALVAVLAAIWAATALAGGSPSSSSNEPAGSGNAPSAEYVQDESETPRRQRGDCPDGEGNGSGDSGSSDATAYDV